MREGPGGPTSGSDVTEDRRRATLWLFLACLSLLAGCGEDKGTVPEDGSPILDTLMISVDEFPTMFVPPDNPITRQGADLGRRIFFDPILSGDSTQACGDCHKPEFSFSDAGERFSRGIDGILGNRNAPSLPNAGWLRFLTWDGKARSLEEQAVTPVESIVEMHSVWDDVVAKFRRHPQYPALFRDVFGTGEVTQDLILKAIAQFERTFVSNNSRYDRWRRGEGDLTEEERRGHDLFFTERGDCFHCHPNGLFADGLFHNIGLETELIDEGLGTVTQDPYDRGKFKTPTLRNVLFTAPYMHDGRFATLEDVLDHYNGNAVTSPNVDPLIRVDSGLGLSDREKEQLIAFLKTLTDSSFVQNPEYRNPNE